MVKTIWERLKEKILKLKQMIADTKEEIEEEE
jgi:hypothetical protein